MDFAIIGASGNVGRKTIEILEKSKIAIDNLFLVASSKSAGKKIKFKNKEIEIEDLENYNFSRAQITFFAAGSKVAKEWVPKAAKETIVIDNSSYFRMQKDVPLDIQNICIFYLGLAGINCPTVNKEPKKSDAFGGRLLVLSWGLKYKYFLKAQNKLHTYLIHVTEHVCF